jgi:heme/copper-type cytochrome/quinol oxidase subunit 3
MAEAGLHPAALPVGACGTRGPGWLGVACLIATESAVFAYLLFSYYYFDVQLPHGWRPAEAPKLTLSLPNTAILLASSAAVWWAERALKQGRRGRQLLGLAVAIGLGCLFVAVQLLEWKGKHQGLASNAYASLYFTITGFHMAHVLAGLIALSMTLVWSALGYFDARRSAGLSYAAAYWHFVDAVWLAVFFTFYVTPYLW